MEDENVIQNEFARVLIKKDITSKGPRLMIQDIRTKKKIYLDPLELESIAWCTHEDFHPILDPSLTRWQG